MTKIATEIDYTREVLTFSIVRTWTGNADQRNQATFVNVAGGLLHQAEDAGDLVLPSEFGAVELSALLGHLNQLWFAVIHYKKFPLDEVTNFMTGIGYTYGLPDDEVRMWQETVRAHVDDASPQAFVEFFDRIVAPFAKVKGDQFVLREHIWIALLGALTESLSDWSRNPEWIREIDAVLARASEVRDAPIATESTHPKTSISLNAELHFHEQDVVSIFHETPESGRDEQFAELAFVAAFTIRSMSNLGNHGVTNDLARQLMLISQLIVGAPEELTKRLPKIVPRASAH